MQEITSTKRRETSSPQTVPITNVQEGKASDQQWRQQSQGEPNGNRQATNGQNGLWQPDNSPRAAGEINVNNQERALSAMGGIALLAYAVQRRSLVPSLLSGLAGVEMLYRGVTGHCPVYDALNISTAKPEEKGKGIRVDAAVTVNCSPEEAYAYWRNLENLPKFMWHVKAVHSLGGDRSHWMVEVSPKLRLEWDARITQDIPNQLIAWHTEPGSTVENGGAVRFEKAPGDRGTEIHATIRYEPPGGVIGEAAAGLFKKVTQEQIKQDIHRFKQILEAGEIPTTEGQPRCE